MDPFILQSVEHDIPYVVETIQETAFQILSLKVTNYPIFIFHKHPRYDESGLEYFHQSSGRFGE